MKKETADSVEDRILEALRKFPEGAGIDEIRLTYNREMNIRTLQRKLAQLAAEGNIVICGDARATVYKLAVIFEKPDQKKPGIAQFG